MSKFIIRLDFRYGKSASGQQDEKDLWSLPHQIFGPYPDDTTVREAISRIAHKPCEEFLMVEGDILVATTIVPVSAQKKRKPGDPVNYVFAGGVGYICRACRNVTKTKEKVMYCHVCDEEPT